MALHSDDNYDLSHHHLASMDIENEGSSSSSDITADGPLNNHHMDKSQPQHLMPPLHTSAAPQQQPKSTSTTNLPLLTACYLSALTTGATTYAFSFYSQALKTSLHLSQNQLDTLSSATFCAGIMSWLPGMVVDSWGARNAMALGGTSNTVMLSMYWMIATERWELVRQGSTDGSADDGDLGLLMFVLSTLGVLIFMGCALVTGSVFKVVVESCGSGTKGKAVGCAKGYVGVGSGVYVCLFGALFGSSGGPAVSSRALSFIQRITMAASSSSSTLTASDVPQNHPELQSLNFLLMAAVLSFLAATLPALLLLPKQQKTSSSSAAYQKRRDGTRSIHFRVVYAGLVMLGMWVVGVSLMELREDEKQQHHAAGTGTGATDLDPSTLNKTLLSDYSIMDHGGDVLFSDHDHHAATSSYAQSIFSTYSYSSYARKLASIAKRRLLSSPSSNTPERRHWGSVFFLLLLWWGPALSLLVIPPRKEECVEDDDSLLLVCHSPSEDDSEEEIVSFDYDDNEDENAGVNNGSNDSNEGEEETFLDENLPITSNRLSSFATKNGENYSGSVLEERNYTLLQMLRTSPAWLMCWTCVIIVGGGTVMTNNIGQMTEALGFSADLTPASLALFSAAQGASRVMTGIASELALKWNLPWFCGCFSTAGCGGGGTTTGGGGGGVPRPAFLVLASLVSAASHFVLAVSTSEEAFAFGVTLSGVAFGMVWPMMVLITGEVFGTRHVGANYMFFDGFSSAAGTLLLSKFVAQEVYDEHIVESHGDPGATSSPSTEEGNFKCLGPGCFRMSHLIISLLSLTCIASSVGLIRTTRDVYQRPSR